MLLELGKISYFACRLLKLGNLFGVETVFPPPEHCSDNAIMIAWYVSYRYASLLCAAVLFVPYNLASCTVKGVAFGM